MLRYAISDRLQFPGDRAAQLRSVVQQAVLLAYEGVDYFQIREKDLSPDDLLALTTNIRNAVAQTGMSMRLVLNASRALAERAGVGWHRTANTQEKGLAVSASCHTLEQITVERERSSLLLFAPVFGKMVAGFEVQAGQGLAALKQAVEHAGSTPVLALGGVTAQNAAACVAAGAAGIASIRMFVRPQPLATTV